MKTAKLLVIGCTLLLSDTAFAQQQAARGTRQAMVQTPLTEVELMATLKDAHVEVFGAQAPAKRLAMAWSQVAFENGRGKYVYNRNIGNTVTTLPEHNFYCVKGQCYRSFVSFIESAKLYWATVRHCVAALAAFDNAQSYVAAQKLKDCRYYDGDVKQYAGSMSSLYDEAVKRVLPQEEHDRQHRQEVQRISDSVVGFPGSHQ